MFWDPRAFLELPRVFWDPRAFKELPRAFFVLPRAFLALPRENLALPRAFTGVVFARFAHCPAQTDTLISSIWGWDRRNHVFFGWDRKFPSIQDLLRIAHARAFGSSPGPWSHGLRTILGGSHCQLPDWPFL